MTALITQCPHCRTRFRVNGMQLSAAKGMVRCGACLEMFDATEHLVPGPPAKPTSPPPAPPATPPAASSPPVADKTETLLIHDDLDLESLELDEELSRLVREELRHSREQQQQRAASASGTPASPPRASYDESWAEALLREEGEAVAEPAESPAAPTSPPPATRAERREPTLGLPLAPAAEPRHDTEAPRPLRGLSPAKDAPADLEIEDEPLQLSRDYRQPSIGRSLLWGLLCLIAALGLAAQYATYHFAELARIDAYRPWFERLCPQIGCEVPPRVDIEQIKSSNLVVRSHPEFAGALTVDAILYNRAPFPQPFPLLELRFADLNGQLIASRRFKPSEYLAGELAGRAEMPPQVPIHIALDILDPGENAVNYSLSFHSPD